MSMDPQTELTEAQLSSRLLRETGNHPVTLSGGLLTVLGGAAAALFASSELFVLLAAGAGVGLATCVGFALKKTVFGRHTEMLRIIEKVRAETRDEREKVTKTVERGLTGFNDEQGLRQLDQLHGKFAAFENVLNLQFDKDELTHKRYLTTAEQLYFGAVDNLRNLTLLWHGIKAINVEHVQSQLNDDTVEQQTRDALQKRLDIYQKAQADKQYILSINEQVMTKLDELTSKLGSIQTREGLSDIRLDTAMKEIMHLINRAEQYDISK